MTTLQQMNEEELEEWAQQVIQWAQHKLEQQDFNAVVGKLDDIITALTVLALPKHRRKLLRFYKTIITQFAKVITNAT